MTLDLGRARPSAPVDALVTIRLALPPIARPALYWSIDRVYTQLKQTVQLPWGFRKRRVDSPFDVLPNHDQACSSQYQKSCRVSAARTTPNEGRYPVASRDVVACTKGNTSSETGFLASFESPTEASSLAYRKRSTHPTTPRASRTAQAPQAFPETTRVVHLRTALSVFVVQDRNVKASIPHAPARGACRRG
jgi:hypothetical protein